MLGLALAAVTAAAPAYAQVDPLADYVRTRAADADGASDVAARGYAEALTANPDDPAIALHAYRVGLAVGDFALVARAEQVLSKNPDPPIDTPIVRFAIALQSGDKAACDAAVAKMEEGPLDFMVPVLRAWLAFDRGEDPFPWLDGRSNNALSRRFAMEHRALIMIALGRTDEGLEGVKRMLAASDNDDLRINAALMLAQKGKRKEAAALLAGDRPDFGALRKALGKQRGKPGGAVGAARLFLSLTVDLVSEDAPSEISILLARSALLLDPSDERARLYLGEALSKGGYHDLALAELARVGPKSPYYPGAFAGRVTALRRAGRTPEAVAQARGAAEARGGTAADARTYGDLLAEQKQWGDAAAAYGLALKRPGGESDWSLHYLQGVALDRAGRWNEAQSQLRRAIELGPNEPLALNYLGNALIEHGDDAQGGQALLEKANRIKPGDPVITDSLGWAYFKRGDVTKALPLLERAAKADPGDPRINEHLGDAYWQVGRRYEARYAWRAAAIYADEDATKRLEGKIANGL
ncbi:tetratricopeptide repeat protein [Sphingomonas sp. LB-2]|uniref:tetratricopeptide repeat protein n=1 Tax=Sphingomonas caeni TaxID=2984949 RepID=UPI0022324C11|nr:tetratricopeptide repeat protein [Sphingomonas caeni]MCW3848768.1 tetratricopeptide repeat protein [Sphingomonas caeni]